MAQTNFLVPLTLLLFASVVESSAEIPLFWDKVSITSPAFGGAVFSASLTESRQLDSISFEVRDKALDIPRTCLEGLYNPYLNGVKIGYSHLHTGREVWSIAIPFDATDSVELEAEFNLVFTDAELLWSYKTIQIDQVTWEDTDVCPLPATLP